MSASLNDLEQDIEESRARLDRTIDRIQDRLTVPGLVDDMLGSARATPLAGLYDAALLAVRRNPIPVALIAAGVGWLAYRASNDTQRRTQVRRAERAADAVPVLNDGPGRIYDPDAAGPRAPTEATGSGVSGPRARA